MLTKVVTQKLCSVCKQMLPASEFYPHRRMKSGLQSNCRTCARQWHRDRPDYIRRKNAEFKRKYPNYHRDWWRLSKFQLTPADIQAMREKQNGLCAGCLVQLNTEKECVDHCHETGTIRGLLCNSCNVSIGRLKDSPTTLRRLADYIERHKAEAEAY